MSGDVEAGSPRPRPLSGGFWTLLSWLRRDEQSSSNESLSSAGSDRTAVSFAFLAPAHYRSKAPPIILPPPGPPTDTYKNRVRERNLRRQYERDITLHRKYGLYRGEGVGTYDAFSLPAARRCSGGGADRLERERRATSESFQRRAAHVPGKRRAPQPPSRTLPRGTSLDPSLTVARRQSRKRPAPQPPTKPVQKSKENINYSHLNGPKVTQMNDRSLGSVPEFKFDQVYAEPDCKPEKYTKKDPPDAKIRPEKSFLKQIFENKKRNSTVDISTVKVLPSISELDKQAAEIIENNKIKNTEEKHRPKSSRASASFCAKCFQDPCSCGNANMLPSSSNHIHHQNASTSCTQTDSDLHDPVLRNKKIKEDEKQKLKEMLKEMKDSLPKRNKHDIKVANAKNKIQDSQSSPGRDINIEDTPTLRIGSTKIHQGSQSTSSNPTPGTTDKQKNNEVSITAHASRKAHAIVKDKSNHNEHEITMTHGTHSITNMKSDTKLNENKKLHTPLKISSLLNPIYVPNITETPLRHSSNAVRSEPNNEVIIPVVTTVPPDPINNKTAKTVRDIILNSVIPANPTTSSSQPSKSGKSFSSQSQSSSNQHPSITKERSTNDSEAHNTFSPTINASTSNVGKLSEHSRRRELVNQLEQSIAKGDERAAAEAAAKLAQLRLSCSVLSFSSQILGEPSTSSSKSKETPISSNQINNKKLISDHTHDIEPLPDLVKRDVVSSKLTKSTQVTSGKVLDVTKCPTSTPPPVINEIKVVSKLPSAQASTSKEIVQHKVLTEDNMTSLKIWIEDKEKARGPIQLHVRRDASVGELRRRAEQSLGLPARLQRWIVGHSLCTDDKTLLISLAGPTLNAPFYLCLVESDTTNSKAPTVQTNETKKEVEKVDDLKNNDKKSSDVYTELVNLERQALVPNAEMFECDICMEQCDPGDGAILRECVHSFCKACLSDVVRHCQEPTVSCPATGCPGELHEREIRALVSADEYERWLARGLAAAESGTRNAFHCRTKDCTGWALCEKEVRRFPCPVCKHTNCVPCQAIHVNQTCEQYQAKLQEATSKNTAEKADEGTQALIDGLISRGEALQCPECSAVITKKWGCDWVKCSACKTEICWITKGHRWGPGGRGDTSGGCRCGVDGKRCHPSCGYCH